MTKAARKRTSKNSQNAQDDFDTEHSQAPSWIEESGDLSQASSSGSDGPSSPKKANLEGVQNKGPKVKGGGTNQKNDKFTDKDEFSINQLSIGTINVLVSELNPDDTPEHVVDRKLSPAYVDYLVEEIKKKPSILIQGNPAAVVIKQTSAQYQMSKSVDNYEKFPIGARHRIKATQKILKKDPDFMTRNLPAQKGRIAAICYLYGENGNGAEGCISDRLIVKAAMKNNADNPGSKPTELFDKALGCRMQYAIITGDDPKTCHTEDLRALTPKEEKEWRQTCKGTFLEPGKTPGSFENVLQLAKRSGETFGKIDQLKTLADEYHMKLAKTSKEKKDGGNFINNYVFSGIQWITDERQLHQIIDNTITDIRSGVAPKKAFSVKCKGFMWHCRMIRNRTKLADYLCKSLHIDSYADLKAQLPDFASEEILDDLCQEMTGDDCYRPIDKLKTTPATWEAHMQQAQQCLDQQNCKENNDPEADGSMAQFVACDSALSSLNKAEVLTKLRWLAASYNGFSLLIFQFEEDDDINFEERLEEACKTMATNGNMSGSYNFLIVAPDHILNAAKTLFEGRLGSYVTKVQTTGYFLASGKPKATKYELANPLKPFLIGHYSAKGTISSQNINVPSTRENGLSCVSQGTTEIDCWQEVVSWLASPGTWAIYHGNSSSANGAVACRNSGIHTFAVGPKEWTDGQLAIIRSSRMPEKYVTDTINIF